MLPSWHLSPERPSRFYQDNSKPKFCIYYNVWFSNKSPRDGLACWQTNHLLTWRWVLPLILLHCNVLFGKPAFWDWNPHHHSLVHMRVVAYHCKKKKSHPRSEVNRCIITHWCAEPQHMKALWNHLSDRNAAGGVFCDASSLLHTEPRLPFVLHLLLPPKAK